jgi:hypothetical protein
MSGTPSAEFSCQLIAGAGAALSRARALLLHPAPQNLDIACSALAIAIAQVGELRTVLATPPFRDLTAAVAGLRKEIDLISRLLEHAASYHVNLMQCMIQASGSPVAQGQCSTPQRRLSMDA